MTASFDLVLRDTTRGLLGYQRVVRRAVRAALPSLRVPKGMTAEIGITLIGPARMRALNRRWRKVDKSTDVLSFPLPAQKIAGYTAVVLGDLFICPSVVRAKASASGTTVELQLAWTVVHGLLHLAGYDHERSAREAQRMARAEQRILRMLKR